MATNTAERLVVKLIDENGNVFAIIGKVTQALRRAKRDDDARAYTARCFNAESYDEVLRITNEYVEVR